MTHLPALRFLCAAAGGVLIGWTFAFAYWPLLWICISLFLLTSTTFLLGLATKKSVWENLTALFTALLSVAAMALYANFRIYFVPENAVLAHASGAPVVLCGTVETPPAIKGNRAQWTLAAEKIVRFSRGAASQPFTADVVSAETLAVSGKVRVRLSAASALQLNLNIADRVWLTGTLALPNAAENRGEFDYRAFLAQKEIYAVMKCFGEWNIEPAGKRPEDFYERKVTKPLYTYISRTITALIPKGDEQSFIKGLLLGDRSGISDEVALAFQKTGTTHVLAISGLHIVLLVMILSGMLMRLKTSRAGKWLAFVLTSVILITYSSLTGNSPPIFRAVIMAEIFLLAEVIERKTEPINTLAFAAIVMLVLHPSDLFDGSFLLTFGAVAALILFQSPLQSLVSLPKTNIFFRTLQAVWNSLAVTIAASIGAAPFISYYFGSLAMLGTLANVPIVLLTNWTVYAMTPALLLYAVSPSLAEYYSICAFWMIRLSIALAKWFSEVPFANVPLRITPLVMLIFYSAIAFAFSIRTRYAAALCAVMLFLINILIWTDVWQLWIAPQTPKQIVVASRVGRGTAVFVKTGSENLLIDAGTSRSQQSRITAQLQLFEASPLTAAAAWRSRDSIIANISAPVRMFAADSVLKLKTLIVYRPTPYLLKVCSKTRSIIFAARLNDVQQTQFFRADVLVLRLRKFTIAERIKLQAWLNYAKPRCCIAEIDGFMKTTERHFFYRFAATEPRLALAAQSGQLTVPLE
ncbi:MAG: ComEC family competence protein [Rhizobacter sp.]|nr:ComEC family competence protein [Chlorobiales bacterium]